MDFCIYLGPEPSQGTLGTTRWSSEAPDQKPKLILNGFWYHLGLHPGSLWSIFSEIFDIRMASFCKLVLKPVPQRLQDKFGAQQLKKSDALGKAWMCSKHRKHCTFFCFVFFIGCPSKVDVMSSASLATLLRQGNPGITEAGAMLCWRDEGGAHRRIT